MRPRLRGHKAQRGAGREGARLHAFGNVAGPDLLGVVHGLGADHGAAEVGAVEELQLHGRAQHGHPAVDAGPGMVGERSIGPLRAQRVQRGNAVVRIHRGAATAHDLRHHGGDANHSHAACGIGHQRQGVLVVLQQHGAFGTQRADELAVGGHVVSTLSGNHRIGKAAHTLHEQQHTAGAIAHGLGGQAASVHRIHQLVATLTRGAGHFQIRAGQHALHGVVAGKPVGHHQAVKAPFIAQHLGHQAAVVGGKGAVDAVVGGHHGPHAGFLHGTLKGQQVQLAQRSLGDVRAHGHALVLALVAHKVLDGGGHAGALHAAHIGHSHLGR